jgi:hypothetical protein
MPKEAKRIERIAGVKDDWLKADRIGVDIFRLIGDFRHELAVRADAPMPNRIIVGPGWCPGNSYPVVVFKGGRYGLRFCEDSRKKDAPGLIGAVLGCYTDNGTSAKG